MFQANKLSFYKALNAATAECANNSRRADLYKKGEVNDAVIFFYLAFYPGNRRIIG